MKKYLMLICSLMLLTACSSNENSENVNSTSSLSTAESSIASTSMESSEQVSTSSKEATQNFPYAVNLDDFVQEENSNGNDTNKKLLYRLNFITNKKNIPTTITINLKDLNDFGKGIYFSSNEKDIFYPISINEIATKDISLIGYNGKERKIKVNTEVKIELLENQTDSLQIVGDSYYLFYNQEKTISIATRDFNKNPGSEDLDYNHMIEYIQQPDSQNTENSMESESEEALENDQYYNSIKEAWHKQKNYIDSIEDPKMKQSVQTPFSAANAEAGRLELDHPEDTDLIRESLEKVLDGE